LTRREMGGNRLCVPNSRSVGWSLRTGQSLSIRSASDRVSRAVEMPHLVGHVTRRSSEFEFLGTLIGTVTVVSRRLP
jgi:hypothetical protein